MPSNRANSNRSEDIAEDLEKILLIIKIEQKQIWWQMVLVLKSYDIKR